MTDFLDIAASIAMAHQGGGAEFPGNTMEAFAGAVSLGYRYVETDVHLSADGVIVICHDTTVDRTTDGTGAIRDLTWNELNQLSVHDGGRLARLDEVLAAWPDLRINIDPKDDAVVAPLGDLLMETGAVNRVCVGAFSDARVRYFNERFGPRICTAMGPRAVGRLVLSSRGLWPHANFAQQLAQIPMTQNGIPVLSDRLINRAHELGISVHIWTIDSPTVMNTLLDRGVDGIITDAPSVLKSVLIGRDAWIEFEEHPEGE